VKDRQNVHHAAGAHVRKDYIRGATAVTAVVGNFSTGKMNVLFSVDYYILFQDAPILNRRTALD
jgi:hypothetical protein